jgi:hypothetical protein
MILPAPITNANTFSQTGEPEIFPMWHAIYRQFDSQVRQVRAAAQYLFQHKTQKRKRRQHPQGIHTAKCEALPGKGMPNTRLAGTARPIRYRINRYSGTATDKRGNHRCNQTLLPIADRPAAHDRRYCTGAATDERDHTPAIHTKATHGFVKHEYHPGHIADSPPGA